MVYIFLSHWPKGSHKHPPKLQNISKTVGYLPEPDNKTLVLKTPLIYIIEHGEAGSWLEARMQTHGEEK